MIYTCGLRASEALRLKVSDVDLDMGMMTILGAKEIKIVWLASPIHAGIHAELPSQSHGSRV